MKSNILKNSGFENEADFYSAFPTREAYEAKFGSISKPTPARFASGGMLTQYNTGGTHEQNPNGGIPLGGEASVEQGESSINVGEQGAPVEKPTGSKYIFSNRQIWTPDDIKAANLPILKKGAVTADAYARALTDKYSDRMGSKDAKESFSTFMQRAQGLAEQKRMQEEQLQQAMAQNAQQNMIAEGPAPEGMEEYAEQPQESMPQEPMQAGPQDAMMAAQGGYFTRRKYFLGGSDTQVSSSSTGEALDRFGNVIPGSSYGVPDATGVAAETKSGPGAGSYIGAGLGLYDMVTKAKKGQAPVNMGKSVASGAVSGAMLGTSILPGWGTGIGALVGGGIGYAGALTAQRKQTEAGIKASYHDNENLENPGMPIQASPIQSAARGGYITSRRASYAGGGIYQDPPPYGEYTGKPFTGVFDKYSMYSGMPGPTAVMDSYKHNSLNEFLRKTSDTPQGKILPLISDISAPDLIPKYPANAVFGTDTNAAHNVQRGLGLKPGPWGPKSKAAFGAFAQNNLPFWQDKESQAIIKRNPQVPYNLTANEYAKFGLTPGGRQYAESISGTSMPATNRQMTTTPYVDRPMADLSEIKQQSDKARTPFSETGVGKFLNNNGSDMLRAYPIVSNIQQRMALKEPNRQYSQRLRDNYEMPTTDEARYMRDINTSYGNRYRAIGQMGGSESQKRADLYGLGIGQNQAISQTQRGLTELDMNRKMQEQQYRQQVAQYNAAASDRDDETYAKDIGNLETQQSLLTGQTGTDIGLVGKEQTHMKQVAAMYGYDWNGKYLINRKTGQPASPEEISKMRQSSEAIASTTTTAPTNVNVVGGQVGSTISKYGGFIKNRKLRR
jgi:hypothetical protein